MKNQSNSAKIALIGETLKVVASKNPSLVGICGQVNDETKNILTVNTKKGIKKLIKEQIVIKIGNRKIDGKKLIGRIETRIKSYKP